MTSMYEKITIQERLSDTFFHDIISAEKLSTVLEDLEKKIKKLESMAYPVAVDLPNTAEVSTTPHTDTEEHGTCLMCPKCLITNHYKSYNQAIDECIEVAKSFDSLDDDYEKFIQALEALKK